MEIAFFCLAVLPYWYTVWLPVKDQRFWAVLAWCCCAWIAYGAWHGAWAMLANNVVELSLCAHGWWRCRRQARR